MVVEDVPAREGGEEGAMSVSVETGNPVLEAGDSAETTRPAAGDIHEHLYLLGRPTLKQFLRCVAGHAVRNPGAGRLADLWRSGLARVEELVQEEPAAANDPEMSKLGPEYEPLLVELLKDPLIRGNFNTVGTDITLVELDRLVVYQRHIDLTHARRIEAKLGPAPSLEAIFRTCLPWDHPQPPASWSRVHRNRFVFVSPSNDLRFLSALSLRPSQLRNLDPPGDLVGVAGIAVGFGSNFLNAIYSHGRLVLNNGSHRAYALRNLGVTHVPCIVQHATSDDELQVIAPTDLRNDPDSYLRRPRPTMLKDYFDSRLVTVFEAVRRLRQVTVRIEIEEQSIPAV